MHALSAFESAARLGGFAAAAEELCVTPSAVSHRIRQLESQLGLALFERAPTGVRLTSAGRRYLDSVREAFDKLAQGGGAMAAERERLRLSVPPTFARQMLMARLPEFLARHPEVEITVNVALPMDGTTGEAADVEVRWLDRPPIAAMVEKLFDDELVVLVSPGYARRLALRKPGDLARAELLRSELLPWRPWFAAAGLDWREPQRGSVLNDLGMLLEVAACGLGVALCTRRIAAAWLETGRLLSPLAVCAASPMTYYLVSEASGERRAAVEHFAGWLGEALAAA
ncbi:MAG: LysR family transcriptional regulator [Zoogloeaceae bacterium]|nr:LysR family transcriptional regulator [Rhodocyclaceae bacterium]MCP5236643.1 LysR family transcriptional regulator [Zoogloeaceae bacterium]